MTGIAALSAALADRYRFEREVGAGGMATVYLAADLKHERKVAIKVLRPELAAAIGVERFLLEIKTTAALSHPHILPLFDSGAAGGVLFYVMPYVDGETLRERLSSGRSLDVEEVVRIGREIADALAHAHQHGVIHRDVKPENILLEGAHARVADFGISRVAHGAGVGTGTGVAIGTPSCMAPEQIAADRQMDHRVDIYALGVLLYELLAGKPPFVGSPADVMRAHLTQEPAPLLERRPDVPSGIADVVMRCLAKAPAARPASCAEVRDTLAAATPSAPAGTARHRVLRWALPLTATAALGASGLWYASRGPIIAGAESLAVTPLATVEADSTLAQLAENLVIIVSAGLDGVGDLAVADPVAVLAQAKRVSARLSVSEAARIGRSVGARSVIAGTLTAVGGDVRADVVAHLVDDVERPLFRFSRVLPRDSVAALGDSIVWAVLREVWRRGAPTPYVSAIDTRSADALRAYLDGERHFAGGRMQEAGASFAIAAAIDTTFLYAHFRHLVARNWVSRGADSVVQRRLRRDLWRLPSREREVVENFLFIGLETFTARLVDGRDIAARHPDYTPALLLAADFGVHDGGFVGAEVADAIPGFERLVALSPSDIQMAEHLATTCAVAGDVFCTRHAYRHLDSLVREEEARGPRQPRNPVRNLAFLLHGTPATRDSFAIQSRADASIPTIGFALPLFGAMFASLPSALAEWDTLMMVLSTGEGPVASRSRELLQMSRVFRGDVSALDSLRRLLLRPGRGATEDDFRRLNRFQAMQELQGLRVPSPSTASESVALARSRAAGVMDSIEGVWIAGLNALLRGDSTALKDRLRELGRHEGVLGSDARRSLAAIRRGLEGEHTAAAESLLTLEREGGDRLGPVTWSIYAADRLLAAEWLSESGRHLQADSLLRFTRSYLTFTHVQEAALQPVYGAAQLVRSRIAEALGQRDRAIEFARIFLVTFDRAGPEANARIQEARQRIKRLGGTLEDIPNGSSADEQSLKR